MHLCRYRHFPSGKTSFLYILQIDMAFPVLQVLSCVLISSAFFKMEDQTESGLFLPHDVCCKQRCLLCAGMYSKINHASKSFIMLTLVWLLFGVFSPL